MTVEPSHRIAASLERTVLPSGVRVLTERVAGVRSVALGVWVGVGSRHETPAMNGATHFLEHLLFKGTARRSARDIAEAFDAVGGDINAFTSRDLTCFHARTIDDDLPMALEIVADMLHGSTLDAGDVESERQVVLQEIAMHEDTPDDIVHDVFFETAWGDHPLARRVQGTEESVAAMSRDAIVAYYREHYRARNMVVAVAGSLEHGRVVELVEKWFGDDDGGPGGAPAAPSEIPVLRAVAAASVRDVEQAHVVYGTAGMVRTDPRRWALGVLNAALGGGMSSRLFQEIREKRGLVYNVYSGAASFADAGLFTIYAGTSPEQVGEVLDIVRDQVAAVAAEGISDQELARAKGHMRGGIVLSLEDPGGRMWHLGKSELCYGEILSEDEMVARVDAVTADDVRAVARDVLGGAPWALTVLGPEEPRGLERYAAPMLGGGAARP